jgi:putative hydrolase of HD superfamily
MRLDQQLKFIVEIDQLKSVLRRSLLCDASRRENSAEHSWHLAVMAALLAEYAAEPVEVLRVLKMLVIHDIVEIDAGDTYAYDPEANTTRNAREEEAAERIFGLLPEDQGRELRGLWDEFEAGATADARYANALDRLQPLLLNFQSGGISWLQHGVSAAAVLERMRPIQVGTPELWSLVQKIVTEATARGLLKTE